MRSGREIHLSEKAGIGMESGNQMLRAVSRYHPQAVYRNGSVVVKEPGYWTPAVHALLHHLAKVGFDAAPRVSGTGFNTDGYATISYIDGGFLSGSWSLEGAAAVGELLRRLHNATAQFCPPVDAKWYSWFGRALGSSGRIIGHCDVAPWNIVIRNENARGTHRLGLRRSG